MTDDTPKREEADEIEQQIGSASRDPGTDVGFALQIGVALLRAFARQTAAIESAAAELAEIRKLLAIQPFRPQMDGKCDALITKGMLKGQRCCIFKAGHDGDCA